MRWTRVFLCALAAAFLAGCGDGGDPFKSAAPSSKPGPGTDKMQEWANKNQGNGKPGNEAQPGNRK